MLAPIKWLQQYTDVHGTPEEIDAGMTMSGSKVEGWAHQAGSLSGVVVGKITALAPHPNADRLQVCQLDIGKETVQIVTGAANVFVGALVPVALPGACLVAMHGSDAKDVIIQPTTMRGVPSGGMLCSGEELGIDESVYTGADVDGILILSDGTPGQDIRETLGIDDIVVDFEITSNRADCLSIIGLAREMAVTFGTTLRLPEISVKENPALGDIHNYAQVEVRDQNLCPRYMARVIDNVKIAPSPRWMADRLRAAGVRPINNIVDITNYVMLEWGQPMHAFDLDQVSGRHIIVRRAEAGETFNTLDGKCRELTPEMLVIADADKPTGIAGVMGGEESEIKEGAKTILFESAVFHNITTRRSARALGLRTEASYRFERAVDPVQTAIALERAVQLVEMLGAGDVVPGVIDVCALDLTPRNIAVSASRINGLLGLTLTAQEMADILVRLGMETIVNENHLDITVPSFRYDIAVNDTATSDVATADIAEEIMRIYGYDKIGSTLPANRGRGGRSLMQQATAKARTAMAAQGYFEALTYSFRNRNEADKMRLAQDDPMRRMIPISNPLGEDQEVMRTLLAPSLLTCLSTNQRRRVNEARLFEVARVYRAEELPLTELPTERNVLGIACFGSGDFYEIKSVVDRILAAFGVGAKTVVGGPEWLHPGRKAELCVGERVIGWVGEYHPLVTEAFELLGRVYGAELDFDAMMELEPTGSKVTPLPRFPAVERDLAVVCDLGTAASDMLDCIRDAGGSMLEDVGLFDIYTAPPIPEGKKSMAFALTFRKKEATLTDDEIRAAYEAIVKQLEEQYKATLRQ